MEIFAKAPGYSKVASSLLIAAFTATAAANAELPNFVNEGKDWANFPKPNQRFVVLNSGLATITAQRFALPKDTFSFPIAGITVFPYYQASPELQDFLNSSRINGIPITSYGASPVTPRLSLPPTDTIRYNIKLPSVRSEKQGSIGIARKNTDEASWLIAHKTGQSFVMPGDSSSLVVMSNGAMFNAVAERTLALRSGIMWVITGARPAAILTRYGAVGVRPHSIAAIEQTWFKQVRSASLYGQPLEMQLSFKGSHAKVPVEKGQELSISESTIASSGSADYVESPEEKTRLAFKSLQGVNLPQGLNVSASKLDPDACDLVSELKGLKPPINDPKMLNAFELMLADLGISKDARASAIRHQKLKKGSVEIAAKNPAFRNSMDGRYFVPGSRRVVAAETAKQFPKAAQELKSLWVQQGQVKYLDGARVEVEDFGRIAINQGEAVLEAKEAMSVRLNEYFLKLAPGAIVHVNVQKDAIVLRNLKEFKHNSVLFKAKGRSIECAGGSELIAGNDAAGVFAEMKKDGVARRNLRSIETAQGTIVINKSEFDLTSLLQYSPIMWKLYESRNEHDRKLIAQVLKMDAVLSVVTSGRGEYHNMSGLPKMR